jgi:Fe-S-cluster-containing dehydrogenase component/CRP-like cAMP-binding protein
MPHEEKRRHVILDAIRQSDILSELLDKTDGHYKYELELEIIVYGRSYGSDKIGPYVRLLSYEPNEEIIRKGQWGENTFYALIEGRVKKYEDGDPQRGGELTEHLPPTSFGVNSFLSGEPRYATVAASGDKGAKVLEIERPAFRLLHQLEKFRQQIDDKYRQHALTNTLEEVEKAVEETCEKRMPDTLRQELERIARFAVYSSGHVLFDEDDAIDKFIFIRNGWVRRSAQGPRESHEPASGTEAAGRLGKSDAKDGLDFLGAGNWLGLETVCKGQFRWKYSAMVMGRTEVLEIDTEQVRSNPELGRMISEYFPPFSKADDDPPKLPADNQSVRAARNVIEDGVVDATNLLVMDMDKCVHCGNCSMACQKVHGHSRLVRRSRIFIKRPKKFESFIERPEKFESLSSTQSTQIFVPRVCMHCRDAECLSGCPTGAIDRHPKGYVDINAKTCIGCGDCAAQCPYDAISLIPRNQKEPPPPSRVKTVLSWFDLRTKEPKRVTETEKLLAAKCNLCVGTPLNPDDATEPAYSCEENCPTGALVRVNPLEYFPEVSQGLGLVAKRRTRAIGRNIHVEDVLVRRIHWVGALTGVALAGAVLWGVLRYALDGRIGWTLLTMRWITGLAGFVGVLASMTYLGRKKIYRRRAGPLRYWMLAHVYLGLMTGFVLLIHAGRDSGGLLTTVLAISFDVAVASGLFGIACYRFVPRLMTKLESNPPLLEDLLARRKELRKRLRLFNTRGDKVRRRIRKKMDRRFFTLGYLFREYRRHEELGELRMRAREDFEGDAKELSDAEAAITLMDAVKAAVTLRRVDALIYLHRLLKLWVAPHVISVSLMLALMIVHIIQVLLFTVR